MTYTQAGIEHFLEVGVAYPTAMPSVVRQVAVDLSDDSVVGFADFRLLDSPTAHLSYVCVSRSARGRGIATLLIDRFRSLHRAIERIQLDVFSENVPARALYKKLGFVEAEQSHWVTREMPAAAGHATITNLPYAHAAFERYGFCELEVKTTGVARKLGRLGHGVIRAFDVAAFDEDELLASVRTQFPEASIRFCIVSDSAFRMLKGAFEHLLTSRRMVLTLLDDSPARNGLIF